MTWLRRLWHRWFGRKTTESIYMPKSDGGGWPANAHPNLDWDDGYDWRPIKREGDPR